MRINDDSERSTAALTPVTADSDRGAGNDIQVIARATAILRLLVTDDTIDVVSAARALGIGRSSAHRYLTSLERHGLLARHDRNSYEVGSLMTQLGAAALARSGVIRAARPIVEALRDEVQQTIALALWNGATAVVAHVSEETSRTAHVTVRVGRALGEDSAQTSVFRAFLQGAARTGQDDGVSDDRLQRIRRTGVAVREGNHDGVRAVAVPVLDSAGAVVATLAAVGVAQLIPEGEDSLLALALTQASARVTEALGMSHRRDVPSGQDEAPAARVSLPTIP